MSVHQWKKDDGKMMIMKRKNIWKEFKDVSVTPADSLFASETPEHSEAPGPSETVPQHVSHFFASTASKRPKTERKKVNVFSLHGYSSLRMLQDGHKACCKEKIVCISWLTVFLQAVTLWAFSNFYFTSALIVPYIKLKNEWKADCSQVDRCHHFSASMLHQKGKWFGGESGGQTNFVCSAKLSKRLPLWSNAKHCAECPPLNGLTFGTARKFGRMDEDAAVYFDFWSGSHTEKPINALWQSLHDVNGPFNTSCSVTRATNALGLAGVDGSDYCVDCFGKMCAASSYAKPETLNAMLASHCKERYACEAFDYDDGRCNKAFFDTVCQTKSSVGEKPSYPRRFSELPGFGFFRDWPHSFEASCALSAKPAQLKSAEGHMIDADEYHRLRALCHLHTRCVRENPALCETAAGCPETVEARLRREYTLADLNTAWSRNDMTANSHVFHFGGAILFPAVIFMIYTVASEMAQLQTATSQYRMCVEVAYEEYKFNKSHTDCGSKVGLYSARALSAIVHNWIIPLATLPTLVSLSAVNTSQDIIFCGSIALVVLQADYYLFGNIITDTRLNEMTREFTLTLSRRQCDRLEIELTVVFWNAMFWLLFLYLEATQNMVMRLIFNPEGVNISWEVFVQSLANMFFFPLSSEVMIEVWCACRESCKGVKISKKKVAARIACAVLVKIVAFGCQWIFGTLFEAIFFYRFNTFQSATGDVHFEHLYGTLHGL